MANYPNSSVAFTNKVDLTDIVKADDVNQVYNEVTAIASDLGAGTGTGLRYSATWGSSSTLSTATTAWTGLQARLANIESGLYGAYTYRVDNRGGSTIQSSSVSTIGLIFKLTTSQSADVLRIRNALDTVTILSINTAGSITTSGNITTTGTLQANLISGGTP
jgi:hypothetical protein